MAAGRESEAECLSWSMNNQRSQHQAREGAAWDSAEGSPRSPVARVLSTRRHAVVAARGAAPARKTSEPTERLDEMNISLVDHGAACLKMGRTYEQLGRLDEAIEMLTQHLVIAKRLGDMEGTCIACGAIGAVQLKMGNHDAALDTLIKQLRLAEELDDLAQQATAMGNLGVTCRSLGRHDEARTWFERQLHMAQSIDDVTGQIQAYGSLSTLFRMLGRHVEAMEMFSKQLQMADNAAPSELVAGQAEVEDDPVGKEDGPEVTADLEKEISRKAEVEDDPVVEEDEPEAPADLHEGIKAVRELTWDEESGADSRAPPDSDEVLVLKKQKVHVQRAQPQQRPDHRTEGRVRDDNEDGKLCDDATISACHPPAQKDTSAGAPSLTDGGKAKPAERKVAWMEREEEQMRKAEEDMAKKHGRAAELVAQQLVAQPLGSDCRDQAWARAIAMKEVVLHMAESVESTKPDLAIILFGRLARAYEQSSSPGNVHAAIELYDKVIKLANKVKMSAVEANAWLLKAEGLMLLKDYESAAKALTQQVVLVERLQDTTAHMNACFKLAGVYTKIGMHIKTLDVLRTLLPLTERLGDMAAQGSALSFMAETLGKIGRFDDASQIRAKSRSVYNQAVQFYTSHLSSREHDKQATAYSKLAVLYKDLGRHTEAIDMLAKAKATQACVGARAEPTISSHPADLSYAFNLDVALDNASDDQVFVCEPQAETCEGDECGKTDRRSWLGIQPSRPEPVSGPTCVGQEGMPPAEAKEEGSKWTMRDQGTEKFDALPEAWGPKNASALDSQSDEWVECEVDAHIERQVDPDMQQEASSGADCSRMPESDLRRSPQSLCNASPVRQMAGPTPSASPIHVSCAVVQTPVALESDEQRQQPVAQDVAVNALVLQLLHLCEEEEWEKAAAMQPQMLPLAYALPSRIASAVYGNLGFALECLAQAADRQYEASTPLWGEAIAMHQKARHAAISIGDLRVEGNACSHLGVAFTAMEEHDDAIAMLNRSLEVADALDDEPGRAQALGKLGNVYFLLGDHTRAIDALQKQRSAAQKMGDTAGESATCGNLGAVYASLNRHVDALEMFQKHLSLAKQLGDVGGQAQTFCNMATSFEKVGRNQEAIECLSQARSLLKHISDHVGHAEAAGRLGRALIAAGHLDKAMVFLYESLELCQSCGMVDQEGQMLHTMGMLSLGLGNYTSAVEHLSRAKAIAYQLQKKPVLAKMCTNLGIVKMRLGAHGEALALHMAAYDIARELDDLSSQAVCAGNIGTCYHKMGRNEEALEILRLYCDLATSLEDNDGLSRTYSHMGAIYRKMGLHHEGAEMFAKAKVLNGDIKNLVGDQPLSESMLHTMGLPSAAARKNRTLEIIEESASSETNETPLDTRVHNCSQNHSPDQRVDEWKKNLDLSLQIDMESGRNWIREDSDLTSPARDIDNSSTDVLECEEPDTESVLEHRDQEESQESKTWRPDIASEILITLPMPASQHDEDPADAEANEEGHAADAEERDTSMELWDPNSTQLLVTPPLPACQYGEDLDEVDANEEKAAATEVACVMANEEERLRKMEEERSAAAEAARMDAERAAAAHAEAARKEKEETRAAAEAEAAAKRAGDEAAAKKAEEERAAAWAAANKEAEEKAAAAAAREEEVKRLEEERKMEETERKRQAEEEERKRMKEEQGHAADAGNERDTCLLEHRDQEEFQERRAWEENITGNSAELLVNLPLQASQSDEDLDEVDANGEGHAADAEEERVNNSLERAEVMVVADEDGAHCQGENSLETAAVEVDADEDGADAAADAGGERYSSLERASVGETRIEKEQVIAKAHEDDCVAETRAISMLQRSTHTHTNTPRALEDFQPGLAIHTATGSDTFRCTLSSPGDDSVSLLSSDLDISTLVESVQHKREEAWAHVAAVQDRQVENVEELAQPQHWLQTCKRASMEIESDATFGTASAAGGLAEEAIMVEHCHEKRRLEDSEPALSACAQMHLDMPGVDCLVQAQQDVVDGMVGESSHQDTHHNIFQVAELSNDAAIENANPQTSSNVSPRQPAAASEIAGELRKTSKGAARTPRGLGEEVPPTNINARSLMYSWLHAQKLPSRPAGSAMPESSSLPPSSWIPEQVAEQVSAAASRFHQAWPWHDSSASEDSKVSGMSSTAATELRSKMFGWLHENEPGPYTPRNNRSVETMAQGSLGMSPRTPRRPSGLLRSPRPDPQVNPRGSGNVGSPPMDHLSQRLLTPRSTVRPEVREVVVDCYWLPELNTCARPVNDFAEWIICPVEAEKSPHKRSLSPVLIPECASHNLVSPSPVLHHDSTWQIENQHKTEPSQCEAEMRYLF